MAERPDFRPRRLLEVLVAHEVDFVLIGGMAGVAHGSTYPSFDLDVAYERSRENLRRLARALDELGATGPRRTVRPPGPARLEDARERLELRVPDAVRRAGHLLRSSRRAPLRRASCRSGRAARCRRHRYPRLLTRSPDRDEGSGGPSEAGSNRSRKALIIGCRAAAGEVSRQAAVLAPIPSASTRSSHGVARSCSKISRASVRVGRHSAARSDDASASACSSRATAR